MTVVLDSSAAVELLTGASGGAVVQEAFRSGPAFAPELIDAEVLAVLTRFVRSGLMTEVRARRCLGALALSPVERISHAGLLAGAWERRASLSTYDALYVALAARLSCPLVTADARIAAAPGLDVAVILVPI